MLQRGRKPATVLTLARVDGSRPRLQPPKYLSKTERVAFTEITAAARHLQASDTPLIASLAQCMAIARRAARDPDRFQTFEKAVRLQAALLTKLRCTPQSRYSARSTALKQRAPSAYDLMEDDE
jgi:hypothetical protein